MSTPWLSLHAAAALAALAALHCCGCAAVPPRIENEAQLREHTRSTLRAWVQAREAPGIAYAVVTAGGPRFEEAAGVRDAATGEAMTPDTMFLAYSTTKAVTAVTVMQLVESGEMSLDAPLSTYYPDHPYGPRITVRMLLAHTAGVPNPMPLDWFYVEGEMHDRRRALSKVLSDADTLSSQPGAEYAYSNVGYWLLQMAVESVTGQPFERVVADRVFAPLGVDHDASFALPPPARLARGHMRKWSWQTPAFYLLTPGRYWTRAADGWSRFARLESHGLAYGGLFATPSALAAMLSDLLRDDGVLLTPASRALMFAPQTTTDGTPTGEALGWVIGELHGQRYVGKQGGGLGAFGNLRIYPDAGIATVFFANGTRVTPGPIDAISDRLDGPFLQLQRAARKQPAHR